MPRLLLRALAVASLIAWAGSAVAQDFDNLILRYGWREGDTLSYRLQAYLGTPRGHSFIIDNAHIRLTELTIGVVVRCTVAAPRWDAQPMDCAIDSAELAGVAPTDPPDEVHRVLMHYDALLEGGMVQLEWTSSGRIRMLDLEGVSKDTPRRARVHEHLRQLLLRLFSLLEIEMPPDGLVGPEGWRQRGDPIALRVPSRNGSMSGAKLDHRVVGVSGDVVEIASSGDGALRQGSVGPLMDTRLEGQARFDMDQGLLLYNTQEFHAELINTTATQRLYLWQVGEAALIEEP
ncbi:MAG: hypothetical protein H6739_26235 [Alphaproteobacteria bacterium]|nr:hypothetical protein [Alphaproteobacteria bacterium]